MFKKQRPQRAHIKSTLSYDLVRKKRTQRNVHLRKKRREEHLSKRRKEDVGSFDEEIQKKVKMIPHFIQMMKCNEVDKQVEATVFFRKILSIEKTPPIDDVVKAGCIPLLTAFLTKNVGTLQFESLWAITNICSGKAHHINAVIQTNAIPNLVRLLQSPNLEVQEQAVWCLGNVCGESAPYRDYVLRCGVLPPLLKIIQTPNIKKSHLRNAVWTLSNVVRAKPSPKFEVVKHCLPYLTYLIRNNDLEVIVDTLWAISYISDGENDRIQAVLDQKILKQLIAFLSHPKPEIQTPALRTIGNIVTGSDDQTQLVIDHGGLVAVRNLFNHARKSLRKEAVWTISNVTAGTPQQIQTVMEANVFPPLIKLISASEFEIRKEAAWALSNATSAASDEQVVNLVKFGCIKPLCDLLALEDPTIVVVALEGIANILERGRKFSKTENPFSKYVEKAQGVEKLESLQHSSHRDVFNKAMRILEKYFENEDENDQFDNYSFMDNIEKDNYTFDDEDDIDDTL